MKTKSIFKNSAEARSHAAMNVALGWLNFCEKVIARGDHPAKLSDCGYDLARAELDRDMYRPFKIPVHAVHARAIQEALIHLNNGLFLTVIEYFSAKKACSECGAEAGDPRYHSTMVRIEGGLCQDCRWYQNNKVSHGGGE